MSVVKCKYLKDGICLITGFKTDNPHCRCCLSYQESEGKNE